MVGRCSAREGGKAGFGKAGCVQEKGELLRVLRVRGAEPQCGLTPLGAPGAGLRDVEILQHHHVNLGCFGLRAKN